MVFEFELGRRDTNPFECDKFAVISLRAHHIKKQFTDICISLPGGNYDLKMYDFTDKISVF